MGRLNGSENPENKVKDNAVRHHNPKMVVFIGAFIAIVIAVILGIAAVYSLVSANVISNPFNSEDEKIAENTSTVTSTTESTSTTSSSTTSSTSTSTTSYTTTSSIFVTTSTTIKSKYKIAACMADRSQQIYFGNTRPSRYIQEYLGDYILMFRYELCEDEDDKASCKRRITDYIEDDNLFYNDKEYHSVGYPVIVKEGNAHIVPSVKSFEKLLDCGSLSE